MTIGCNIWMICLKLNGFFYGLSRMLQFSEFVWTVSYSLWDVFNKFLLIDATDRSKISSDQKCFLSHQAYTPFHFSRTLCYNYCQVLSLKVCVLCITRKQIIKCFRKINVFNKLEQEQNLHNVNKTCFYKD